MSELVLDVYDLDTYRHQLPFGDDLPVVLGYLRVSRKQTDERYSLDVQSTDIRRECKRRFPDGCHMLWIAEDGYSGKLGLWREGLTSGEWRPGLHFATQLISSGLVNYVACYDCSRLARSLYVWFQVEQLYMAPHSVVFFSASEGLDTSTEISKEDVAVIVAMASGEWDNITRNNRDGRKRRREENYFVGSRPYGWEWQHRWKSQGEGRSNIIPVLEEANAVKKIVHMCLSGMSRIQIRDQLQSHGILSTDGYQVWLSGSLLSVLRNPVNCGFIKGIGGLHRGAHYESRIIEECEYHAVQQILSGTDRKKMYEPREQDRLYEGLAVCGLCGAKMGVSKSPIKRGCYVCLGHRVRRQHPTFTALSDRVYGVIFKSITDLAVSQEFATASSDRLCELLEQEFGNIEKQRSLLSRRIESSKREYVEVTRRSLQSEMSSVEFSQFRDESRAKLSSLEDALDAVENKAKTRDAREKELRTALAILCDFPRLWAAMEFQEKKDALACLVSKLILTPNETHVTMHLELVLGDPIEVQLYSRIRSSKAEGLDRLTPNEILVASLLLEGQSVTDIASEKNVLESAVHLCMRKLKKKAGTSDIAEALKLIAPYIETRQCDLEQKASWTKIPGIPINEQHIQLLELVGAGFNIREMARMLGTKEQQIVSLRYQAYYRLGVTNRDRAIAEAIRRGLIPDTSNRKRPADEDVEIIRKLAAMQSYASVAEEHVLSLDDLLARLAGLCAHCGVARNYQLFEFAKKHKWIQGEELDG